jgi:hypothetical protein
LNNLACFAEEKSAKAMSHIILPEYCRLSQIITFEEKNDLDKQIEKKLESDNTSTSFKILISGVKKLCTIKP